VKAIDIDVGGTFTDLVLTWDDRRIVAKSPTTPYDLSVGFLHVLNEGAALLDEGTLQEILPQVEIVRYSTTVAMNRLIERKGPKLGLITTEGHEDAILIGRGAQWTDGTRIGERRNLSVQRKPEPLINRDMIVGVGERVDSTGAIIRPLDEDDVRTKLRHLVDNGARAIAVSLLWSFQNPEHERAVRRIIREEYKGFHVGYLPVVLSHEVVGKVGEYERTMTAILDAYLQTSIKFELETTWDQLRANGYRGTFLLTHNTGGSAEIFKTTASRTFNGGPVSGLIGSFHIGQELGYRNVIASDVGGTSFDVGMVVDASVRSYEFRPIFGAGSFVRVYLDALARDDVSDALTIPGVRPSGDGADTPRAALLHNGTLTGLRDLRQTGDEDRNGRHLVSYDWTTPQGSGSTSFQVERIGTRFGLFPEWGFAVSPLATVSLAVEHDPRFTLNGVEQLSDGVPGAPVEYAVLVPGAYSFAHTSRYLTADPDVVLADTVGQSLTATVDTQANTAFVATVSSLVNDQLRKCATQQVLFPSGCSFGQAVDNRVSSTPEWSIVAEPQISIVPSAQFGSWEIPSTPGTAHLVVTVTSLFDGTTSQFDQDVPFQVEGDIALDANDSISVTLG
jgi:hypothetical protein